MNKKLITSVESIKTATLQSSNLSDVSDEFTSIILISDFKLSDLI